MAHLPCKGNFIVALIISSKCNSIDFFTQCLPKWECSRLRIEDVDNGARARINPHKSQTSTQVDRFGFSQSLHDLMGNSYSGFCNRRCWLKTQLSLGRDVQFSTTEAGSERQFLKTATVGYRVNEFHASALLCGKKSLFLFQGSVSS